MLTPGGLFKWMRERKAAREALQVALRRRGMKPDEGHKLKYDSWSKVYRFRYYDADKRRWI